MIFNKYTIKKLYCSAYFVWLFVSNQ